MMNGNDRVKRDHYREAGDPDVIGRQAMETDLDHRLGFVSAVKGFQHLSLKSSYLISAMLIRT